MRVYAIDPGNIQSAMCIIDATTLKPISAIIAENESLRHHIIHDIRLEEGDEVAIEALQSYGNLIGKSVLDTAVWIGRFYEMFLRKYPVKGSSPTFVYRMEEKMHICNDSKAGDPNIRRALIDRFCTHDYRTGKGTAKKPDWFHGFSKDMWAAYAVGLTHIEKNMKERINNNE